MVSFTKCCDECSCTLIADDVSVGMSETTVFDMLLVVAVDTPLCCGSDALQVSGL
jgi:hypothetical protein